MPYVDANFEYVDKMNWVIDGIKYFAFVDELLWKFEFTTNVNYTTIRNIFATHEGNKQTYTLQGDDLREATYKASLSTEMILQDENDPTIPRRAE